MKQIIIDTNFLLIPIQFKVDIFAELKRICSFNYELCILEGSLAEVNKIIATGSMVDRRAGKIALRFIYNMNMRIIPNKNSVDDAIVEVSDANTFVATQDKMLRKRLKEKEIPLILMRKKKFLVMER